MSDSIYSTRRARRLLSAEQKYEIWLKILTQASNHPPARRFLDRRTANGNIKKEAMRALKRRLSDVVYRALLADAHSIPNPQRLAA